MLSTEPDPSDPSSDDELDTEDELLGSAQANFGTQRARDGYTEGTHDLPRSAPLAPASTRTNSVVGVDRSQMKRKESESIFASEKRARYAQDDVMGSDLDEHAKKKRNMSKSAGMSLYIY